MSGSSKVGRFGLADVQEEDIEIPEVPLMARSTEPVPAPGPTPVPPPAPKSAPAPSAETRTARPARQSSRTTPAVIDERQEREGVLVLTGTRHDETAVVDLATTSFLPTEERMKTTITFSKSIVSLLEAKVYEMKSRGFRKITRDAVVEDALKLYFGLK